MLPHVHCYWDPSHGSQHCHDPKGRVTRQPEYGYNTTPHTTPPTSPPYPHTTYTFFLVTTRPRLVGGRQEKQKLQRAGQGKGNQKIQRYHKHTQPRTLSHHSTLITHSHPLSPNYAFSTCLRPLIRARSRGTCEREAVATELACLRDRCPI